MDQDNRAERDQQLREPEPDSLPADDSADLPDPGELELEGEGEMTSAVMAVRGSFLATQPTKETAVNSDNMVDRQAMEAIAARAEANHEEEAIVARVLAGDTEAFAELIDRYKVAVYNLCARMLHDQTEAEDAAQEVFVRAYTQLHSYTPGRRFSTWILSIASHYCIDLLRRRKPSVDLDSIAFWKQSDQPEPEERALSTETRDEVRDLLTKLPDKYRGVTVLRYWQDLSYEEIAASTGLSVATVKTRLFRARELLAKELEKQRRNGNQTETEDIASRPRTRGLIRKNKTVNGNAK